MMKNSDNEENNTLEPLLKRRNQLAALVERRRKNMNKSSKFISSTEGADKNLQPVKHSKGTISQLKMTSPEHEKVQTKHSISSDIIEDTDEEMTFDIKKRPTLIRSSSESDSNASSFPINKILVDDHQTNFVKEQQRDPNKVIKVLSTVIVKKSSESGKIIYLGAATDNTTSNIIIKQKKKISLPLIQASQINLTSSEPHKDSTASLSFQQPAISLPTAVSFIEASMMEVSDPENMKGKSEVTFCDNPQQSSNLPSTTAESADLPCSDAHRDGLDTTRIGTSLHQISISSPSAATFTDNGTKMYSDPENMMVNTSDVTFCDSPQQSLNLLCDDLTCYEDTQDDVCAGTFLQENTSPSMASLTGINNSNISGSNDNAAKMRPKRKKRKLKAFIDFISDEDKQDFSSDSSDLWSCDESALSSDEDNNISKKKKKRRKESDEIRTNNTEIKKKEKPINNRKVNKKLKDQGKTYENRKGEIVSEKTMKTNPCVQSKCARGCYNIPEERRTSLFQYFWSLDSQRRKDWIVHCAHNTPIKRKKTKNDLSRRNNTYEYFINDGEGHKQVCQKFLIDTSGITQKFITYTLGNSKEDMAQEDLRKPNVPKKYTEEAKTFAQTFIEKLPAVPSHYNRKKSKRTYLPQEMKNILNLHKMYLKYCLEQDQQALSENALRTIFKQYNISFHIPKKDKCVICVKAENNKDEMSNKEKDLLSAHLKEKKATYKRFKKHQTIKSPINKTITCSFDLQKVLNTPHGQSMLLYYSRKYSVFNFTIYESGTQDVYCFTWGECDGKRGSNEIATCLIKYLKEKDKQGVKHLLMYCDSCSGQNKNKNVLAAANYFLKSAINLEVVQINYLLPGHTYMPVDTVHAVIEREVRKVIVWSPSQWSTYFESARKNPRPYKVHVLDYSDFLNFDHLAANAFTPMTTKNIKFRDIRVATFKRKYNDQVFIKYSMEDDAQTHTIILREKTSVKGKGRGKGQSKKSKLQTNNESLVGMDTVKQLYNCRIPIAAAKYKDLINLCENGTIPKRFHGEYRELPCNSQIHETLNETDEEDDKTSDNDDK